MDNILISVMKRKLYLSKVAKKVLGNDVELSMDVTITRTNEIFYSIYIWRDANIAHFSISRSRNKSIAWIKGLK